MATDNATASIRGFAGRATVLADTVKDVEIALVLMPSSERLVSGRIVAVDGRSSRTPKHWRDGDLEIISNVVSGSYWPDILVKLQDGLVPTGIESGEVAARAFPLTWTEPAQVYDRDSVSLRDERSPTLYVTATVPAPFDSMETQRSFQEALENTDWFSLDSLRKRLRLHDMPGREKEPGRLAVEIEIPFVVRRARVRRQAFVLEAICGPSLGLSNVDVVVLVDEAAEPLHLVPSEPAPTKLDAVPDGWRTLAAQCPVGREVLERVPYRVFYKGFRLANALAMKEFEALEASAPNDAEDLDAFEDELEDAEDEAVVLPRQLGNWIVIDKLGKKSGQGEVFKVRQAVTGEFGALKRILPSRAQEAKAQERFRREIETTSALRHPCIAKCLDRRFGRQGWIVTEWLPLGSLQDNIVVYRGDVLRALRLARDVALGLECAHSQDERIVHRDVKPSNVLLRSLDTPVICDFGIAHRQGDDTVTDTDEQVGAFWYLPPEGQGRRLDDPPPSFDVYSLGKLIYMTLRGGGDRFPREEFRAKGFDLGETLGSIGPAVDRLLARMICAKPEERFQSMVEVRDAIDEVLERAPRADIDLWCVSCGKGRYSRAGDVDYGRLHNNLFQKTDLKAGRDYHFQICDRCGHMPLFAPKRTQ